VKLRGAYEQRPLDGIVVGHRETNEFAASETGRVEEYDREPKHRAAKERRRPSRKCGRGVQEPRDLLDAEDVRSSRDMRSREPVRIRQEAGSVGATKVEAEVANDPHPRPPHRRGDVVEGVDPFGEDGGRDRRSPSLGEEAIELDEQVRLAEKAAPERLLERQVCGDLLPEPRAPRRRHGRTSPGTSSAASRRSSTARRR